MSLFGKIFEKRSYIKGGSLTETSDFWYSLFNSYSSSGINVTKANAMKVAMVSTCIFLRANTIAQFPLKLKRRVGDKTEDATDHPLFNIVKLQPNSEMSSFCWRQAGQANVDTTGNEYGWIERNRLGIQAIWPLPPETVEKRRANNEDINKFRLKKNDVFVYDVLVGGRKTTIQSKDVLHFLGFSFDGKLGQSVIGYASNTIGNRMELDDFQGKWMRNGLHISGVIEHPETFGDNKQDFIDALKEKYSGGTKKGAPLVLENGVKYNQIKVSLADQQFIEQAELTSLEIARIFQVPPSRVGIPGVNESNASLEQENKRFLDTCIMPIVISREQTMNIKLLTPKEREAGYYFKYNLDALLRPDAETRAKVDKAHWEMGKPYNEIRKQDDLNPIKNGDISYVPMNYMDASQGREEPTQENKSREIRSIASRDKIRRRWEPIIKATSDRLVRFEANAITREANKQLKNRAREDFLAWAYNFYTDFRTRIENDLGVVLREYMLSMASEIRKETGSNISNEELETEIRNYIDGMAGQWIDSSQGQLEQITQQVEDSYAEIILRVEEWKEKKTEKVTLRQSSGASNFIANTIFFALGLSSVWRNRGKSCKYCRSLEGKVIKKNEYFVDRNGVDPGDGDQILIPRGRTSFPPLHGGCDCYVIGV